MKKVVRRITALELARWLSLGKGQMSISGYTDTHASNHDPVPENIMVRKWGDGEWHEATSEYCI